MRILVTGGLGYAGSRVAEQLMLAGHSVSILDNASKGAAALNGLAQSPNFVEWISQDVAEKIVLPERVDAVVHLAALVGDKDCDVDPLAAHNTNVIGTRRVLELSVPTILFSTSAVYGSLLENAVATEATPLNPATLYAETKAMADREVQSAGGIVLRLNHMFGASPSGRWPELVNELSLAAKRERRVRLYHPGAWRACCHVQDAAIAVRVVLQKLEETGGAHGVWNVVGQNVRKRDIAGEICSLDTGVTVEEITAPHVDPRHNLVDGGLFLKSFGWRPMRTVRQGIEEVLESA